jgi:hypothetical protein
VIPKFPQFKKIDVSDKDDVESFTHRYPPYSDFNFTSMLIWDTAGESMISTLNGNLVVQFTDYCTDHPFMSFLGSEETENTARTLVEYSRAVGLTDVSKLLPETSVKDLRASTFQIEEDRDSFDYIYSIPALSAMCGSRHKDLRRNVSRFRRAHPNTRVEMVDLRDKGTHRQMLAVLEVWEQRKKTKDEAHESARETHAIHRLLETAEGHSLIASALFQGDAMLGFCIDEPLPNRYCMGHFWKADSTHAGAYDILIHEVARHLEARNVAFWNCEQDLGIAGLRFAKTKYGTAHFLKKYTLSLHES